MVHRHLHFITFNVRSLIDRSRQNELRNILVHNQIDIAFIQECHLRQNQKVLIHGYEFLYDGSSIGVAILIKKTIQYKRIVLDGLGFYSIFIQIDSKLNDTHKQFLLGSLYFPCNYSSSSLVRGLNKMLNTAVNFDGFIFGGDLNAKNRTWGDAIDNCNGKILLTWLLDNSMDVIRVCDSAPSFPNGSSFLDHYLLSTSLIDSGSPNFTVCSLPTFSDHFPIKLQLSINSSCLVMKIPRIITSYKNTDWSGFCNDLDSASALIMPPINENLDNEDICSRILNFNDKFSLIHDCYTEKFEVGDKKPPHSDRVKKLHAVIRGWQKEMKKIFHRNGNRVSREYNLLSKQSQLLRTIIGELENLEEAQRFDKRLQIIKPGPQAFKEVVKITGKKTLPFCDEIRHNDSNITDSSEIAEVFKEHYTITFQETVPEAPVDDLFSKIASCVSPVPQHIFNFSDNFNSLLNDDKYHFTEVAKVSEIISRVNSKKSSGVDGVSNFIIKKFPRKTLEFLTIIFNNCLNNCYFPLVWKSAKIIPIRKKPNSVTPGEFRPISLLSNIGKILEHILKEKMENEFIINPTSDFQFGFKPFHSTQHALLKFHTDLTLNLRQKISTVAISLDIEKAFDSANHSGILYKLIDLGLDPFLVKIIQNYLSERNFCVQINNILSDFGNIKSGVPQGSVLAPFLFNLLLYDFPHTVENSQAILYADDCLIYSHNVSPTQALRNAAFHLGHISAYYKIWGVRINAAKSEAICIRNPSGKCSSFVVPESKRLHLSLDGVNIPFKNSIKYLGVNFDKLMKFNTHARGTLQKAKRVAGMFSSLWNNKYLPINTKLLLYKVCIRSLVFYGFPIWFTISPTVGKELEIFERKILRKCIGKNYVNFVKKYSNTYIYKTADVQPFCSYAFSLTRRFVEKLISHENDLMNEIFTSEENIDWNSVIYLSPVGILNEVDSTDNDPYSTPAFYDQRLPGTHRG